MIMRLPHALGLGLALGLGRLPVAAQDPGQNSPVEQLQQQLQQLRQQFEETQRQQGLQIEALQRRIEAFQAKPPADAAAPAPADAPPPAAAAPPAYPEPVADAASAQAAVQTWTPAQPIPVVRSGQDYLNLRRDNEPETALEAGCDSGRCLPQLPGLPHRAPTPGRFGLLGGQSSRKLPLPVLPGLRTCLRAQGP